MGKFTFTQTEIPGVVVIEPQVFGDDRGYFMETYQKDQFAEAGIDKEFVQDNQSRSTRGVLRGLHFQKNHTQGKLVRCDQGRSLRRRRGLPPQQRHLRQVGGRDPLRGEQEDVLYPRGLCPRLPGAERCGRVLLQVYGCLRPHQRGRHPLRRPHRQRSSGPTAAASTRPAQRTSCTSPLPPRSSSILKKW